MFYIGFIHALLGLDDVLSVPLDVADLALEAAGQTLGTTDYDLAISKGRSWLVTMNDNVTGGFRGYPGDTGLINNEVSGEALAALPEPATMGLLVLGGLTGLLRRRPRV